MSLFPTKTRLRHLRGVAAGEVFLYGDNHTYDGDGCRADAAMAEMQRAGWVVLGERTVPHKTPWTLTAEGERVCRG